MRLAGGGASRRKGGLRGVARGMTLSLSATRRVNVEGPLRNSLTAISTLLQKEDISLIHMYTTCLSIKGWFLIIIRWNRT